MGLDAGPAVSPAFGALTESMADGVYLVDAAGRVLFVNDAGLAVLGYERTDDLVGRPSHATIHSRRPDGSPFPEEECPLLRPRTTGEAVRIEEDWFVRRDGSLVPVSYSSAPIETGTGRGAVVIFHDITERRQADEERRRAAADRARAEELQASRSRIVAAADAERQRLGRDLHDGAQQRVVHLGLLLQRALGRLADGDADAARPLVADALEETRRTMEELRSFAAGIHPALLTSRGLKAAVESLAGRTAVPTTTRVVADRFSPDVEAAAYFVVAEALTNVSKHAAAHAAHVEVAPRGGELVVEVRDDGRGGAALRPEGGLHGLEDRVGAAGGRLAIDSAPGRGTTVRAALPLRRA